MILALAKPRQWKEGLHEFWRPYRLRDIYWFYDCHWYWKRKSDTQSHTSFRLTLTKMYAGHTPCLQWQVLSQRCISINLPCLCDSPHPTTNKNNQRSAKSLPKWHLCPVCPQEVTVFSEFTTFCLNKYWLKWYFLGIPDQQYQHQLQNLLGICRFQAIPWLPKSDSGVQTNNLCCYQSPQEDSNGHLSLRAPRLHISRCPRMMILAS